MEFTWRKVRLYSMKEKVKSIKLLTDEITTKTKVAVTKSKEDVFTSFDICKSNYESKNLRENLDK